MLDSQEIDRDWTSELRLLADQGAEQLRILTALHDRGWGLAEASWYLDLDKGTIEFTSVSEIKATCSAQVIGTRNLVDGSWLWAWDHPSVSAPLCVDAQRVRQYGEDRDTQSLLQRKIECTEAGAWRLTALALRLASAQGAYRAPIGNTHVFVTFHSIFQRPQQTA